MNKKDLIIFILFVLFLILAVGFLFWVNSQGAKCLSEPYKFTYNSIKPSPLYCECILDGSRFEWGKNYSRFSNSISFIKP